MGKKPRQRFSLALEYAHIPQRLRRRILGLTPLEKKAKPPIKKHAVKRHPVSLGQEIVSYCHLALTYAGRMVYDEGACRSELFHRNPGDFQGAHADCSQFVASILHWCGIKTVTGTDFTGTLLEKGKHVKAPAAGRVVIFGADAGVHGALVTEKHGAADWYVVGFGQQAAPDRVLLSDLKAYFARKGHPGVRYLEFAR